jgi:DNA end-binding protein Ku
MPRSNWKGYISFGLVSIPVVLYPAQNPSADIHFHQIDKRNNARIKYQRINAETGKKVEWSDIIKGYQYDKENIIPVPDDVLKKVAGETARTIGIDTFIDKIEFDILTIDKSYYIAPDKNGDKGYVLLREALISTGTLGIAKVIISTREYIAAVAPYENALVLFLLLYDSEMRKLPELNIPKKESANKKELEIANKLIKSMKSKWKPEKYKDDYQKALHQWVDESVNNLPHAKSKASTPRPKSNVVNFVDLLKKSLASKSKSIPKKRLKVIKISKAASSAAKRKPLHH